MEIAVLFLLPLAGGYIFASNWGFTRFALAREDGHRLYFRAAFWGATLFATFMIVHIACYSLLDLYSDFFVNLRFKLILWFKEPEKGGNPVDVAIVSVVSMLLAYPLAQLLNWIFQRKRVTWILKAVEHDDIERILYRAAIERRPIAVTMANRKVYVGFIIRSFDPSKLRKSISVLPLLSGCRMEPDGRLKFTTFYTQIYGSVMRSPEGERASLPEPLGHLSAQDFEVALPLELVQSVSLFDLIAYRQFQKSAGQSQN